MNQTGRRIASAIASLLLVASVAGMLFTASFAQETVGEGNHPVPGTSQLTPGGTGTIPATEEGGSATEPEPPPPEEGSTTFENDPTGSAGTTTYDPTIETTFPETGEGTGTDPVTGSATTVEPPVTTEAATKAPSRDPVLSQGAAMSEGQIGLSPDKGGNPAQSVGSPEGADPDNPSADPGKTDSTGGQNGFFRGEEDVSDPSGQKSPAMQITVICAVFAILSGAVLVLLKLIR